MPEIVEDELAQALSTLRDGLLQVWQQDWSQDFRLGVGDVEVTLQMVAMKQAGGKIGWSILGADGSYGSGRTHTVKLTLQPMYRTSDGTVTRDVTAAAQQPTP